MKDIYKTIHKFGQDFFIEKKSKFIGYAKHIDSEEEAIDFIDEISLKHKDATHNVYAYVVGENSNIQRYNDDGEPSGTAGIPILEVIKKEDLRNVVIVVTRYFGGIKLGAGGLVRAYVNGAKIALHDALIVQKILYESYEVRFDYTFNGKMQNSLSNSKFFIKDTSYDDAVNMTILARKGESEELKALLMDLTSGEIDIVKTGEEYLSFKDQSHVE